MESKISFIKINIPRKDEMAATFGLLGASLDAIRTEVQKQTAELQKQKSELGNIHRTLFDVTSEIADVELMTTAAGPASCGPEIPAVGLGYTGMRIPTMVIHTLRENHVDPTARRAAGAAEAVLVGTRGLRTRTLSLLEFLDFPVYLTPKETLADRQRE